MSGLLLIGLAGSTAWATDLYLSPAGVDGGVCSIAQPCRTFGWAIDQMVDGDTLLVADGVYAEGGTRHSGCKLNNALTQIHLDASNACPANGCSIRALNLDSVDPRVTVTGVEASIYAIDTEGWTIEGIRFIAPSGTFVCRSPAMTFRDLIVEFDQSAPRTAWGSIFDGADGLILDRYRAFETGKKCWTAKRVDPLWQESDGDHDGLTIVNSVGVSVVDSYFGHMNTVGILLNVHDLEIRRSQFQHFTEHGLVIGLGATNLLFDNVIWDGTTWGHCWDGTDQTSLTATQCRDDSVCLSTHPGTAEVCRVDDCFCERGLDNACGTCPPGQDVEQCMRGARMIDVREVDGLVVRNNTVAGHGYNGIDAIHRSFTQDEAYATCGHYPGYCEIDPSVRCTELQGDTYCATAGVGGSNLGRCIPECRIENFKFYNNVVYDLTENIKGPGYVRVPFNNPGVWPWLNHSNIVLDSNLYSGKPFQWIGEDRATTLDGFCSSTTGPDCDHFNDCAAAEVCVFHKCASISATPCTTNDDCPGFEQCRGWQVQKLIGQYPDPNGLWFPDIAADFASYATEDYSPSGTGSAMVDSGLSGVDPDGVAYCSTEDFDGNLRCDGGCDIGAYELQQDGDADGVICDNCPQVSNPGQADSDGDGLGDTCDGCASDPANDADADGLCGDVDNCPAVPTPGQSDLDIDGVGDLCDDEDGDGLLDIYETGTGIFVDGTDTGTDPGVGDTDGDGFGDGDEVRDGFDPNDASSAPGGIPLAPRISIDSASTSVTAIAAGDLDGDGRTDVVAAATGDGIVGWHRNLGGATFDLRQSIDSTAGSVSLLRTSDLNGDGRLDLLAADPDRGNGDLVRQSGRRSLRSSADHRGCGTRHRGCC